MNTFNVLGIFVIIQGLAVVILSWLISKLYEDISKAYSHLSALAAEIVVLQTKMNRILDKHE